MEISGIFQDVSDVHIWTSPIDTTYSYRYHDCLVHTENARSRKFVTTYLQDKYIVQRGILRTILGNYLVCPARSLEFISQLHGKPVLKSSDHRQGSLSFNLSHTKGLLVVAVAIGTEIGVDVEFQNKPKDWTGIAKRYFTEEENDWFLCLPDAERSAAFYDIWTMKEAAMKADGRGLSIPVGDISFDLPPGQNLSPILMARISGKAERWWGRTLNLGMEVSGAVVCQNENANILVNEYQP